MSRRRLRVLVAIANHGTKNLPHLHRLLDEYRSMEGFQVDLVVLSDGPKQLGADVELRLGAPTSDPWSLPFAHRPLFAERQDAYDLFVYSEDDTLVTERNLAAFLEVDAQLPDDQVPGYLRFERAPTGERWFNDAAFGFHWDPSTPRIVGDEPVARFTNPHAACFVLTRRHLERCIRSGGFLVPPHAGRLDMLVSAATDPYTQCGLEKVIPIRRLDDFLLRHLPDKYVGWMGQPAGDFEVQVDELIEMARRGRSGGQLMPSEKPGSTVAWDKRYDERPLDGLVAMITPEVRRVLSIGVGTGAAERELFGPGCEIVGVPLDPVVASAARARGIRTTAADLEAALAELEVERFDVVLFLNVIHHFATPIEVLRRFSGLLSPGGSVAISAPNLRRARLRRLLRRPSAPPVPARNDYARTKLHWTNGPTLTRWTRAAGLDPVVQRTLTSVERRRFTARLESWLGTDTVVIARRSGDSHPGAHVLRG